MRIFIGIDLDAGTRDRIESFLRGLQTFAPDLRWAPAESLHVTLKFVGEQTNAQMQTIAERLDCLRPPAFEIRCAGYGFFPTATAPRAFWLGVQAGPQLARLAADIDAALAELGVSRENRPYRPHLTLARARGQSGALDRRSRDPATTSFEALKKHLALMAPLDFGNAPAREFILYQSQLSPTGSRYTRLRCFPMSVNPLH